MRKKKNQNFGVTPSQTIGPFFHYGMAWEGGKILAGAEVEGEAITIEGCVTDGKGAPVDDALVEIWQADAAGRYAHPEDNRDSPLDPAFTGFGRSETDGEGKYRFQTVKPGRVPGPGNTLQAPHISFSIFARGLLKHISTRLYFADEATANAEDPLLSSIEDETARNTLLATPTYRNGKTAYRFDIRLQGDRETVFFKV